MEPDLSTGKHRAKPRGRKGQSRKSRHSDAKCLLQLTRNSLLVHQTAVVSPALRCCSAVGPAAKILPCQGHRDSPASLTGSSRTRGGLRRSRCRCWLLWLSRDVFWALWGCLVEEQPVFGERWGKVLALGTAGSLWEELAARTPPRWEPPGALDLEGLLAGNPCGNEGCTQCLCSCTCWCVPKELCGTGASRLGCGWEPPKSCKLLPGPDGCCCELAGQAFLSFFFK